MVKLISRSDTQANPSLLTPWSIIHFFTGVIAGLLVRHLNLDFLWTLVVYIIANALYEAKDVFFTKGTNSWQNSIADILIGVVGYLWVTQTIVSTKMIIAINIALYLFFASPMNAEKGRGWSFFFDSWYTRD